MSQSEILILAPLPLFDATKRSLTNMWHNRQGARTSRYKRKGFFFISFAPEEISLLELLLNTGLC